MSAIFQRLFGFLRERLSYWQGLLFRGPLAYLRSYFAAPHGEMPSEHLRLLKQYSEAIKAQNHMVDNFPPTLTRDDGPLLVATISIYGSHYYTAKVAIKREPHKDELGLDIYGNPCVFPYISDRIRIEAANIQFIAKNTTIPVPKFLGLWLEHGLWHIKTSLVEGALELRCLLEEDLQKAVPKVEEQLETEILPQLRRLRRSFMGCADPNLPVVPPHRFWAGKDKRVWSSMPTEDDNAYVFCHTDLGRQNIMVDPKTYRIVSIIDWETAGFFPASWELPLWKTRDHLERYKMTSAAKPTELTMIDAKEPED